MGERPSMFGTWGKALTFLALVVGCWILALAGIGALLLVIWVIA
jgi:hypothetical protein